MNRPICFVAMWLVPAAAALGASVVSEYQGPASGNWNVASHWTPRGIPNNGGPNTFEVNVDADRAATVLVNIPVVIDALNTTTGNVVRILAGAELRIAAGPVANAGEIEIESGAAPARLMIGNASVAFDGPGQIFMEGANARIGGASATSRLVNGAGHTIAGAGALGEASQLRLSNFGEIRTESGVLLIDIAGLWTENTVKGVLRAVGTDATLHILNSQFDNTDGEIRAEDLGEVVFQGATIAKPFLVSDGGNFQFYNINDFHDTFSEANLIINAGSQLYLRNSFTNGGALLADANTLAPTQIVIASPNMEFSGSGTLFMTNQGSVPIIRADGQSRRMTNAFDHTIAGTGLIGGDGNLRLTNEGIIAGMDPANPMVIAVAGTSAENINSGFIRGLGFGKLSIFNTQLDNSKGQIESLHVTVLDITNSLISGGHVNAFDSGTVNIQNSTLSNVTTSTPLFIPNSFLGAFRGQINNTGEIRVMAENALTRFVLDTQNVTLNGAGVLRLENPDYAGVGAFVDGLVLTNGPEHSIIGRGVLGNGFLRIANQGTITADGGNLQVSPGGTLLTNSNSGVMEAINGGTLRVISPFDSTNGMFVAGSNSVIDLSKAVVLGGLITTEGAPEGQVHGDGAELRGSTLDGDLYVDGSSWLTGAAPMLIAGDWTNDGTIHINSDGVAGGRVHVTPQGVTMGGEGQIVLANSPLAQISAVSAGATFVNGEDHTIRGGGRVGMGMLNVNNAGQIVVDAPGGMEIHSPAGLTNSGLVHVDSGVLTSPAGTITNTGVVDVDSGASLNHTGNVVSSAGEVIVDGSLTVATGTLNLSGATLTGSGTVNGTVANAGTVAPGTPIGMLTINGSVGGMQGLQVDLAAGGTDLLQVSGPAQIGGTLVVTLDPNFVPLPAETVTVLSSSALTGTFATVKSAARFDVEYTATSVVIHFPGLPPVTGDLNDDQIVDGADLGLILGAWGTCVDEACPADLNGDGEVDGADLGILLGAWS